MHPSGEGKEKSTDTLIFAQAIGDQHTDTSAPEVRQVVLVDDTQQGDKSRSKVHLVVR